MTRPAAILILLITLLLLTVGGSILLYHLQRQRRLATRLQAVRASNGSASDVFARSSRFGVSSVVEAIGSAIAGSGLLSQQTRAGLEQTLTSTGLRGSSVLGLFVGAKILLLLLLPLLTFAVMQQIDASPLMRNLGIAAAALVGLLAPNWWIGWRYKQHLHAITVGLPDALDLMVICTEAGLSFEPAIIRVALEIRGAHPVVSDEFSQTASELRVVADSKVALANMGNRTGLEGVKRMTSMLAQTMKYGTPLSDALRVLSAEMRQEILIRYETRAARLPVLLTIPMIVFILPCIFLIVGGPAVVQVMHTYTH